MGVPNTKESTFTDGVTDRLNINTSVGQIEVPNATPIVFFSDAYTSLTGQIKNGTLAPAISATAAAIATSGTVTTASVGIARLNPASAVTAIVMQAGTFTGQQCWLINEAVAANSITFDVSGTSNVADGTSDVIPGLQGRLYVWDGAKSLWYATPQLATVTALVQSGTAAATASSGSITTASVGVARVSPVAAITSVILQAGTVAGQQCWVLNEAVAANSVTFAASGTSHVAQGTDCIIYGLQSRLFVWDSSTSLWYAATSFNVNGTIVFPSGGPGDPGGGGTITTSGVGVALLNPAAARTGVIMQAGGFTGQICVVANESAAAKSITFDVVGTSNVADGVSNTIWGGQSKVFVWDAGIFAWVTVSTLVSGTIATVVSATTPDPGGNGTIATAGVGVALTTPAAARTGIILGVGTINGQELTVINQGTAGNSLTMAASGTSNVADGTSDVISNFTAAKFVWNSTAALWYRVKAS